MDGSGIIGIIRSLHNERYGTRFKETDAGRPDPRRRDLSLCKKPVRTAMVGRHVHKPEIDSLFAVNPKTGKETLLLTRERINQALEQEKLGKLSHLYQVSLPWAEKTQLLITLPGNYIVYDWKADKIISKQAICRKGSQ